MAKAIMKKLIKLKYYIIILGALLSIQPSYAQDSFRGKKFTFSQEANSCLNNKMLPLLNLRDGETIIESQDLVLYYNNDTDTIWGDVPHAMSARIHTQDTEGKIHIYSMDLYADAFSIDENSEEPSLRIMRPTIGYPYIVISEQLRGRRTTRRDKDLLKTNEIKECLGNFKNIEIRESGEDNEVPNVDDYLREWEIERAEIREAQRACYSNISDRCMTHVSDTTLDFNWLSGINPGNCHIFGCSQWEVNQYFHCELTFIKKRQIHDNSNPLYTGDTSRRKLTRLSL
ncbi:MAG: hypothetical protein ABIA04_05160 [Pseudomonadota bacterium]